MRKSSYRCLCLLAVVSIPCILQAQVIKVKTMSLKHFPEISAIISIENAWGAPVLVDPRNLTLYEEGTKLSKFSVTPRGSASFPVYTVIVMDKSGSMKGAALEQAKLGAIEFIKGMRGGDQAAFLAFDTKIQLVLPFTNDQHQLMACIAGTQPGSDTALLDAIFQAAELMRSAPNNAVRVILALTDGRENRSRQSLADSVNSSRASASSVYTIGLGSEIDSKMLKEVAQQTEGNYYHAPDPQSLVEIYRMVSDLLHSQLYLTFKTSLPMDDKWHALKIIIPYMGKEISGEKSYLSAKESKIPAELLKRIQTSAQRDVAGGLGVQSKGKRVWEDKTGERWQPIILLGVVILLLLLLVMILIRRRR